MEWHSGVIREWLLHSAYVVVDDTDQLEESVKFSALETREGGWGGGGSVGGGSSSAIVKQLLTGLHRLDY